MRESTPGGSESSLNLPWGYRHTQRSNSSACSGHLRCFIMDTNQVPETLLLPTATLREDPHMTSLQPWPDSTLLFSDSGFPLARDRISPVSVTCCPCSNLLCLRVFQAWRVQMLSLLDRASVIPPPRR